jgi:DNA-binding response OmpR family regulator
MNQNQENNTLNKKKVFVVDDDTAILDALSLMLEEEGYEVKTSQNGKELEFEKYNFPDLILLDIWMSGVSGKDICMQLKKDDLTKDIPVIMISASNDTEKIAEECGADGFMYKPFQVDLLLDIVHKYLDTSKTE